jgi:hypothetical protein
MKTNVEFFIGEVVEAADSETYIDTDSDSLYTILVKTYNDYNPQRIYCRPADINIKQIPLIGEHVFIYRSIGVESNDEDVQIRWYYLNTLPLQSSIHHNSLPGTTIKRTTQKTDINSTVPKSTQDSNVSQQTALGDTFQERSNIPFLQPYEGDLLIEGRFGNSIRFGSTHTDTGKYSQPQSTAFSGPPGYPIIILSNGKPGTPKKFTLENVDDDYSSLYLTSPGQEINTIQLSKEITRSNGPGFDSQFIGSADKVVLQAKTGTIVLDAANRISMNADEILMGSEGATSPLVKGDVLETILIHIISAVRSGVIGPAGAYSTPIPGSFALATAESLLNSMKSTKFKIDKE